MKVLTNKIIIETYLIYGDRKQQSFQSDKKFNQFFYFT